MRSICIFMITILVYVILSLSRVDSCCLNFVISHFNMVHIDDLTNVMRSSNLLASWCTVEFGSSALYFPARISYYLVTYLPLELKVYFLTAQNMQHITAFHNITIVNTWINLPPGKLNPRMSLTWVVAMMMAAADVNPTETGPLMKSIRKPRIIRTRKI